MFAKGKVDTRATKPIGRASLVESREDNLNEEIGGAPRTRGEDRESFRRGQRSCERASRGVRESIRTMRACIRVLLSPGSFVDYCFGGDPDILIVVVGERRRVVPCGRRRSHCSDLVLQS